MKTRNFTSANAWHKLGSPKARLLLVLAVMLLPCLALAADPVPFIQQIFAPSAQPGSTDFIVIYGGNFDPTLDEVYLTSPGGTFIAPSFTVNSNFIQTLITAPSPAKSAFITVHSAGGISNAIPFPITTSGNVVFGNTSICFGVYSNSACTAGTGPQAVALGDFNNDGNLDIAVVNSATNDVSILISNGDGTFRSLVPEVPPSNSTAGSPYGASTLATYAVGHNPQAVVVGDFNNDGKLDLAVANENDNTVSILLGNGDGTFQAQIVVSGAAAPVALAVADFNGDGNLDFAVVNQTDKNNCGNMSGDGSVLVFTGDGKTTPTFTQGQRACVGILPTSVVAGVFSNTNGDGLPDLAVTNAGGNSSANCPPASGTVTFIPSYYINGFTSFGLNDYCAGKGPSAAVAGDFNGDGTLDVVVTNSTAAQIAFLPGNNSGFNFNFQTPATFPAGGLVPNSIVAGDFNGDGILDVAVADQGSSQVSILQGDGSGNFNAANGSPYATTTAYGGRGPTSLVAADFNGDGRLDIATADNSDNFVTVMLQSPAIQFTPSSLNFNLVPEGSVSTAQTVKVTNTGIASANVSSVSVSGPFKLNALSTTCPTAPFPLAGGSSCFIGVTFNPTSIGTATGALTLQTSTGQAVNVSLAGSGIAPVLNFSPSTVTFGGILVGQPAPTITVNVTNVGDYAATINSISIPDMPEFGETDNCIGSSLPAGSGTCAITVSFTPSAAGLRTTPMNISFSISGGGSAIPATVPLSGDGTAPVAFFTPTPLTFANQPVGTQSSASTIYLLNDGTAPMTISAIGLTGVNQSDFSIQSNNCPTPTSTLAVSTSCSVNVTFTPSAEGTRTAALQFTDNASSTATSTTQTVGLSGNGAGPLVSLVGGPVIFGNQQVGTTSGPATVSLTNLGTGPLTITNVALGGTNPGDFTLTQTCPISPTQLPQFGSCSDTITFTPIAVGTRSATLTFTDNNNALPGSMQPVTISGTSTAGTASLSTGSVAFGAIPQGTTSAPMSLMLSNTGTAPLTVTSILINSTDASPGEFTETDNCVGMLAQGTNCTITIKFTPSKTGTRTATLTITDNGGGTPSTSTTQTVSLSGTGTDFSISVSPGSETVSPGKVALFTLTLTPISGFSGSVTLGCAIVPPTVGTTCTVPAGTVSLSGSAQKHIAVSVKPKKGTYTLTFSATYTATPPASGTITRYTTPPAKVISK